LQPKRVLHPPQEERRVSLFLLQQKEDPSMKNISNLQWEVLRRQAFVLACVLIWPATSFAQEYQQTILVSNASGQGATTVDASLVDPWGIARSTTSPWWVSDRATGVSTVYNAAGTKLLQVTIPNGSPTGVVFNGSTADFFVTPGGNNSAHFIFVSLNGTISAWSSGSAAVVEIQEPNSVFTGVTIAQIGDDRFLYAADLQAGKIKVFDTNFHRVEVGQHPFKDEQGEDAFDDEDIPKGFAPFNVQNIGNNLYVAYAQQNQAKNFVNFGAGLGFVDVFSPRGRLLMRLEHGDWFNAPFGLVLAPTDFGSFSHKLIVGQFGSGEILVFDAITGRFEGKLRDQNDNVIVLPGLWGISFGAGQPSPQNSGPANALFFNAGINQGMGGLFGTLTPVSSELTQGGDQ
jgi:uncharacterized protein (TIGR03118 family)